MTITDLHLIIGWYSIVVSGPVITWLLLESSVPAASRGTDLSSSVPRASRDVFILSSGDHVQDNMAENPHKHSQGRHHANSGEVYIVNCSSASNSVLKVTLLQYIV